MRHRWLDVLARTGRRLTTAEAGEDAARTMVTEVARGFDVEAVSYREPLPDGSGLGLVAVAGRSGTPMAPAVLPLDNGVVARAFREGRAIVVHDIAGAQGDLRVIAGTRSEAAIPLRAGDRIVGVLHIESSIPGFFDATAVEVLEAVTRQAEAVRESAELRSSARRHLEEQQALHAAALDLLATRPLALLLRDVAETVVRLCGADESGVYLVDADGTSLVLAHATGSARRHLGVHLAFGEGLSGRVAVTGRPELVADYATWSGRSTRFAGQPWGSALAVPLLRDDEVVGILNINTAATSGRTLDADAVRVAELLAPTAALAITNAQRSEARLADLAAAEEIARRLGAATDAADIRRAIVAAAVEVIGCRSAGLVEEGQDGALLRTAAAGDEDAAVLSPDGRPTAVIRAVLGGRTATYLADASDTFAPRGRDGSRSFLLQPLARDGRPTGVLIGGWRLRQRPPTERERWLFSLLAGDATAALERADLFARLRRLARRDALTGTLNRRSWEESLPPLLERARADATPLAVAMIDLDHFKVYNDRHGHQRGDLLLREAGSAWQAHLREGDLLARYGGEEFAIALPRCAIDRAADIVERLRRATPAGQTCSAGLAVWDGEEPAEALVARADAALYEAKQTGRDRTAAASGRMAFPHQIDLPVASWTRWTGLAPGLIRDRAMRAAFQPVVDLGAWEASGRRLDEANVIGYEALARPTGTADDLEVEGLFLAAQYGGLSHDLDWVCRRAAVEGAVVLPSASALFINVGVATLLDPVHTVDQLLLLLDWAGIESGRVVLEFSERDTIRDVRRLVAVLDRYREAGLRFALDDVGDGHSTLEVLAATAPEFIKIAGRLGQLVARSEARAAVRAVVAFADEAGAQVIAEGMETEADVERLLALRVGLGQGWALGRPGHGPGLSPA